MKKNQYMTQNENRNESKSENKNADKNESCDKDRMYYAYVSVDLN